MRVVSAAAARVQRVVSRSRLGTAAAVKVGNFARQVVMHRILTSIHMSENGEGWLLSQLGPSVRRFVDVGANVGDWSAAALIASPSAAGLLVEPSANAFEALTRRFVGDERVTLIAAAAGPDEREGQFFEEPNAGNTSSLIRAATHGTVVVRSVAVRSIDGLLAEAGWSDVDILKVDCEGYDYFVLQGASASFRAGRIGVVQFEYNTSWRDAGASIRQARSFLNQAGYEMFFLKRDGLYEGWEKFGEFDQYSNFVAVSPTRMPALRSLVRGTI
jgi:FkbM family methyltransferase